MKIKNILIAVICLTTSTFAFAHCPSSFKEEKVCLMLDSNMIYIYDQKFEHNGPYKDFAKAELQAIKSTDGKKLEFKKIARGIYKFEAADKPKTVTVEVLLDKKKQDIKVVHE